MMSRRKHFASSFLDVGVGEARKTRLQSGPRILADAKFRWCTSQQILGFHNATCIELNRIIVRTCQTLGVHIRRQQSRVAP